MLALNRLLERLECSPSDLLLLLLRLKYLIRLRRAFTASNLCVDRLASDRDRVRLELA